MENNYDFLRKSMPFWLNTSVDNKPASRPFGAVAYDGEYLYISTGKGRNVYNEIINNPNIQITSILAGTREWIRITGIAYPEERTEKKELIFNENKVLYNIYNDIDNPILAVFRIEILKVEKN